MKRIFHSSFHFTLYSLHFPLYPFLFTLSSLLFPITLSLRAQSTQPIKVLEYKEKSVKTPLASVGVTVTNAGAAMTDAQGEATLRFRTLLAGDRVQVRRIELAGYEVFNQEALDQWAVSPANAFQIILCRSDRFRELRENYMRVASASYDKQLKADKARLDKERKRSKMLEEEYQRRLQELQDQYDQQLEDLDNYIERFSRIDLSELTAQEQEIIDLVQAGQIEQAVKLYESRDYVGQYQRETKEIAEIDRAQQRLAEIEEQKRAEREAVLASIDRQISTYQLAGGVENWAKVSALLRSVADADTTNYKAVVRYAEHALKQNHLEESEKYMGIGLRAIKDNNKERARTLFLYGNICANNMQLDKAIAFYQQSIDICETMIGQYGEERVRPQIAEVQSQLHSIYNQIGDFESQLKVSPSLLDRMQKIYAEEDDYWTGLAIAQAEYALAILYQQGDTDRANQLADQSYQLAKQHYSPDSENGIIPYVQIINSIIYIYEVQEAWDKQIPILVENISALESLYVRNPERYGFPLFETCNNLADTYLLCDQLESMPALLQKDFDLMPALEKNLSIEKLSYVYMSFYDTCAQYYQRIGNADESQRYARLCMKHFQMIPPEYQQNYLEVKERWAGI